jgi:cytochrome c biogenesis protein CcdA
MVSHETGRRIDKALHSWGRFVLWTRVAFAVIGVLMMTFGAIVFPDSRLVTIPTAVVALAVGVWTLRGLRRPASGRLDAGHGR